MNRLMSASYSLFCMSSYSYVLFRIADIYTSVNPLFQKNDVQFKDVRVCYVLGSLNISTKVPPTTASKTPIKNGSSRSTV